MIDPREAFRAAIWTASIGIVFLFVIGLTMARAESGVASWYSGGGTACGDRYVQPMSAAHRSLPCNTRVRVSTGSRSIVVTIRDRGPFLPGRIIDLSKDAAEVLGLIGPGVLPVTVEVVR